MTVSDLLTAIGTSPVIRVDLKVGNATYRVDSNEASILNSTTLALSVSKIELAVDNRTAYMIVTTGE